MRTFASSEKANPSIHPKIQWNQLTSRIHLELSTQNHILEEWVSSHGDKMLLSLKNVILSLKNVIFVDAFFKSQGSIAHNE